MFIPLGYFQKAEKPTSYGSHDHDEADLGIILNSINLLRFRT